MWLEQSDYELPGIGEPLAIHRTYNSANQYNGFNGWFGIGWTSNYDVRLINPNADYVQLRMPSGQGFIFRRENNLYFPTNPNFYGTFSKNADDTFTVNFHDGHSYHFRNDGRPVWLRDRNGNQTSFNYDEPYRISVTDPFNRTLIMSYNSSGFVTEIADSQGVIATYSYSPNLCTGGNICRPLGSVTYADGSKYEFEYLTQNGNIYLTTVKDALGNILEKHEYDAQGRATTSEKQGGVEKFTLDYSNSTAAVPYTQVTDALGRVTKYYFGSFGSQRLVTKTEGVCSCGGGGSEVAQYLYNQSGNLTKKIDALSRETTYTYDSNGNRLTMTDVLGSEVYTYNSLGQILTRRDRMNGVWVNTYDATGNLLTSKDPLNNTSTLTYTALGQLATIKNARNNTTTLTHDSQGRLTQIKDANNKNTNFGYDSRSRVTSTTNVLNETTSFEYDPKDRLKKVTYPDANFVQYAYDLAGRRTGMTDARNNTTAYAYDGAYRLTGITDPLTHTTTFVYDLMSKMTSQTDALGNTTNFEYDDFNRLKKTIYPPSASGATRLEESLTYDTLGSVKTRVDTAGRTTSYDYDTANRLIKITDALANLTQFEYNARSQMTKVKDALNQEYNFTYDPLGRQLSQTRAGSTMSFEYDAVGNRTKRTDYMGRQTTYEFDVLNRLKKINYLSGTGNPVLAISATYSYDDLSRLTSAVNEAGAVGLTYDNRNRLKTETDVFGHLVEYGYDPNGNRILLKLDGVNHATYVYDNANRLTGITNSSDNTTTAYAYDIADRLTSRLLPNGVTTTYDYDGMSRLSRLKDASTGTTIFDRQYSYNSANQISQIAEPDRTKTFGYDNVDRLTSATDAIFGNESYAFDAVGNRTSSHRSATYTYQPFNRTTGTANSTMMYDLNGNMIQKSEGKDFLRYTWDYENRLTEASTRKQRVRYKYDALGRRVERNLGFGKERTKFTHDGQDVLLDDNSGTLTKYQNGPGIDNKLRAQNGTSISYFLADHLGSTDGLADSTGNVASQTAYDSFGNQTSSLATRYGFTGRERDDFTGLMYYRARFYDPSLGRFISEDPIGLQGGINLFAYVNNDPKNLNDPLGLFPDNPYDAIPESVWTALAHVGNAAAGFGDTVTLGGTRYVRQAMGTDGVVDPCSGAYMVGDIAGTIIPLFMGGAGAAKGALAMGGRSGGLMTRFGRGAGRFFHDPRSYSAVRANYWNKVTGYGPANGSSLHHWFTPQRAGGSNAGWNLFQMPLSLNRWMGYDAGAGRAVEMAMRIAIPGSLPAGATAGGIWGVNKSDWQSECGCR